MARADLFEIGGGYLVWKWLKDNKWMVFGLVGGLVLFAYGIIPTFQSAGFGRVYATYGGIFVMGSIMWGYWIDKKKTDRYEIIGSVIVIVGVAVLFYFPKST